MHRITKRLVVLASAAAIAACGGQTKNSSGTESGQKGQFGSFFVVTVSKPIGGKVTSSDGQIDCGKIGAVTTTACSASFLWGVNATLSAVADASNLNAAGLPDPFFFQSWAGDCSGASACVVGTDGDNRADKTVVAVFNVKDQLGHSNIADPALHAPLYRAFLENQPNALQCTKCHGAALQGVANAPACTACHGVTPWTPPALPPLAIEPAGVVGRVTDLNGAAVANATVYLVPQADVAALAATPLLMPLGAITAATRNATNDEPLEDLIEANALTYTKAVTDAAGAYRIPTVSGVAFFVVVVPDAAAGKHLPGGTWCRAPKYSSALVGKQLDIQVTAKPAASATYVGATACYACHGGRHEQYTLHMNGIRPTGKAGPLQKGDKYFPRWNEGNDKFTAGNVTTGGTTLYYWPTSTANSDWKLSETDPGTGVVLTARLYTEAGKYWVQLKDRLATPTVATYEAEFSYGGGLYKQRWFTWLPNANGTKSRYILPIQYNSDSAPVGGVNAINEAADHYSRWQWQHYNLGSFGWLVYNAGTGLSTLNLPLKTKAFDNNCAGCHFTGFSLTGNNTDGWSAHGTPDVNGEADFDGDGKLELMNTTCENCHGPGSDHAAGKGKLIVALRLLTPEREVTVCAACHTRTNGQGGASPLITAGTEAPLNQFGLMALPGTKRSVWLTDYVSKIDDGIWAATAGDGIHSQKHHQQATDFLKSLKYRNPYDLLTCASCHDPHGTSDATTAPVEKHQLKGVLDAAPATSGLCLDCHSAFFPAGATVGDRMQAHWVAEGINFPSGKNGVKCSDCHNPKTAKSGAGLKQALIGANQFWSGDITSHLFKVPRKAAIATGGVLKQATAQAVMPIPYTNKCGGCHSSIP